MEKVVNGSRLIDLARLIPSELLELYEKDNTLVDSFRVAIIDFNFETHTLQSLGPIPRLRKLSSPKAPAGRTYFSVAFEEVRSQIIKDYNLNEFNFEELPKSPSGEVMMKPAVLIVTDGIPSDKPEVREKSYQRLGLNLNGSIDKKVFPFPPQIIVLGVGEGEFSRTGIYDTSKLDANSRIRRSRNFSDVGEHMREIAHWIQIRISKSMANPELNQDDDWFNTDEDDFEDPWV